MATKRPAGRNAPTGRRAKGDNRGAAYTSTMPAAPKKPTKRTMSAEHKAALAEGREQGRAVRDYLVALEAHKPRRGRKRTPESMKRRIESIETKLETADPLSRLHLLQELENLQEQLHQASSTVDLADLEAAFVAAAGPYSRRKSISADVWRKMGVAPAVLKKAGIK